jgi:hypothetical protein
MMLEAKDGPHHMARVVACMVGPLLVLVASPLDSLFSWSSIFLNMMWQKVWVCLTFGRSLKVKNKKICFAMLKPNEWGLFRKPPD